MNTNIDMLPEVSLLGPVFYERRSETIFIGPVCKYLFPAHVHGVTEIVCLLAGSMEMTVAGQKLRLQPGDIAIAFPNVPHSYEAVSDDADGLALMFLPDTIGEFTHTFRTMLPVIPILRSSAKPPELVALIRSLRKLSLQENSPLRLGYLHLFLSYLLSSIRLEPMENNVHSGLCYQVLQYISEHFTEPLSLESTAHALGISRIHLSHIFSQQLHINFRQYINMLRIDLACALLRNPSYSISEVAYQCGYGNQRTFHRAFLAQCGMPPNRYRTTLPSEGA